MHRLLALLPVALTFISTATFANDGRPNLEVRGLSPSMDVYEWESWPTYKVVEPADPNHGVRQHKIPGSDLLSYAWITKNEKGATTIFEWYMMVDKGLTLDQVTADTRKHFAPFGPVFEPRTYSASGRTLFFGCDNCREAKASSCLPDSHVRHNLCVDILSGSAGKEVFLKGTWVDYDALADAKAEAMERARNRPKTRF